MKKRFVCLGSYCDKIAVRPCLIPTNLPRAQDPPEHDTQPFSTTAHTAEQPQTPEEEARDILAKAMQNQAEDGLSTRSAAIRAYKYLHAMVRQQPQKVYEASKEHATRSKGTKDAPKYRPRQQELPAVPPQLASELLHCLSTLPEPWPLAKITINLDTASQWDQKWEDFSSLTSAFDTRKQTIAPSAGPNGKSRRKR